MSRVIDFLKRYKKAFLWGAVMLLIVVGDATYRVLKRQAPPQPTTAADAPKKPVQQKIAPAAGKVAPAPAEAPQRVWQD